MQLQCPSSPTPTVSTTKKTALSASSLSVSALGYLEKSLILFQNVATLSMKLVSLLFTDPLQTKANLQCPENQILEYVVYAGDQ
jgi:hypothetical protein